MALATIAVALAILGVAALFRTIRSATAIQYWFRLQVYRGGIRRRQIASCLPTDAVALASVSWAAAAALAAGNSWLAAIPAVSALLVIGAVRLTALSRR